MDEQKKEISVDDILREYEAMAEEPDRASRPQPTIEPDGDQVWRPAQQPAAYQPYTPPAAQADRAAAQAPAHGGRSVRASL